jgi:hypothetical protein
VVEPLEPVPATREAFRVLGGERGAIGAQVAALAEQVRELVPETVGVSLSLVEPGVTFTLAAPGRPPGPPEAGRRPGDGPGAGPQPTDPLDEERWSSLARSGAHDGVLSSLSVPVHQDELVVGGLDVYAATADAFAGRAGRVAALVRAPAEEVVLDADLAFASRGAAEETARTLADRALVDVAAGLLAQREGVPVEEAVRRLEQAAAQAGLPVAHLAQLLVRRWEGD